MFNKVYRCTDVQVYITSVHVYKCTGVQMFKCTSVQMYRCTDVQVYKCTGHRCTNVQEEHMYTYKHKYTSTCTSTQDARLIDADARKIGMKAPSET